MVSGSAPAPATDRLPARDVLGVAIASGGAFAGFYCLYSAASLVFADARPSAGVRVAVLMVAVVAVQPLVLVAGRWMRARARVVGAALMAMAVGLALLPVGDSWPGSVLLGAGFGVFVVTSTAWTKELAAPGRVGRALGVYGLGSALGGALGAPLGLVLAARIGMLGVVGGGAALALLGLLAVVAVAQRTTGPREPAGFPATAPEAPRPTTAATGQLPGGLTVPGSLTAHLLAVTLYAAVLSSTGSLAEDTATAAALAAFATQSAVALGRLAGGALGDRWSAGGTTTLATGLLALAVTAFTTTSSPVTVVVTGAAVGAAAGAVQTAALTLMMRHARTPARTEQVSAAWNITFDLGLGAGALAAGLT